MTATQTWFITGTSSGFGRAFAQHALAQGHRVVATARRVETLADLVAQAPDRVLAVALDVDVAGAAEAAIAAAVARFGRIDVLVNNAGYGVVGALEETPDAELRALFDTNFFGAMAVIRAALPVLREQRGGAIVNMSSLGGQLSFAGFSAYSATKFALEGASEALAGEVAPFGIRVTIVEPGPFRTDFAGRSMQASTPMAAYAGTPARGARDRFRDQDGVQPGDPARGAAAIIATVRAPAAPLRLPLGKEAVARIRTKLERQLADMESTMALTLSTAYP